MHAKCFPFPESSRRNWGWQDKVTAINSALRAIGSIKWTCLLSRRCQLLSSLCHWSLYLIEAGLVEGLPAARIVAHVVGRAAIQPVGVADPTVLGKVLQHNSKTERKGWANTQAASPGFLFLQFLLAGITIFCLLRCIGLCLNGVEWHWVPGVQHLTGLWFIPSLSYILFNKHFHTFGHFLFINHYNFSLWLDIRHKPSVRS